MLVFEGDTSCEVSASNHPFARLRILGNGNIQPLQILSMIWDMEEEIMGRMEAQS